MQRLGKGIRYALVQLRHPFIKNTFTESNVVYGVESDLNSFIPQSQFINWDWFTRRVSGCETQRAQE
jgi:hypothetical protein